MIEAKNLVRRYGEFAAVDDVTFAIGHGEVVGLLGHNGAGKTTIMKMLTGFLEPSGGSVLVDGLNVQDDPLQVQANMGYLPETLPLYPELTVMDFLSHAARLRGLDPAVCVADAVAATQLEVKAFDRIDTLSRGYKQRLGVAQAILHKPRFLILDEPSNGLDPNQIQHMRDLIRRLAENATVILSTHIMQEVNAVCDRTIMLSRGRVLVDEKLDALRRTSAIRLRSAEGADVAGLLSGHQVVASMVQSGPGRWRVTLSGDLETGAAAVAQAVTGAGLPLYELAPEVRDLESLFTDTAGDQEVQDAA